jgi:hypothetical protein
MRLRMKMQRMWGRIVKKLNHMPLIQVMQRRIKWEHLLRYILEIKMMSLKNILNQIDND